MDRYFLCFSFNLKKTTDYRILLKRNAILLNQFQLVFGCSQTISMDLKMYRDVYQLNARNQRRFFLLGFPPAKLPSYVCGVSINVELFYKKSKRLKLCKLEILQMILIYGFYSDKVAFQSTYFIYLLMGRFHVL